MKQENLTPKQVAIIEALKDEHLTSSQILNKVDNISMILLLYNVLQELRELGILQSYMKKETKYHYIC